MRWCALLGLVACGRFDFAAHDAGLDAPFADGMTSLVVIDMLVVPTDGTSVTSSVVVASTGTYHLRASGVIITGGVGDMMGDAEYHDFTAPDDNNSLNGLDYGVSIDEPVVGQKTIKWGPYASSHVYEVPFTGRDQTIAANFHDDVYSNNVGTLSVEILH